MQFSLLFACLNDSIIFSDLEEKVKFSLIINKNSMCFVRRTKIKFHCINYSLIHYVSTCTCTAVIMAKIQFLTILLTVTCSLGSVVSVTDKEFEVNNEHYITFMFKMPNVTLLKLQLTFSNSEHTSHQTSRYYSIWPEVNIKPFRSEVKLITFLFQVGTFIDVIF